MAYWSNHKYTRHSVDRDVQLTGFIGWSKFSDILGFAETPRNRSLMLSAFKIGGRINEVLGCRHENFRIVTSPDDGLEYLLADSVPLSKRWRQLGKEKQEDGSFKIRTEHVKAFRTFALPLKDSVEPFSEEFSTFVLKGRGLLFPSPYRRFKGERPLTTTRAYQIVHSEIGGKTDLWLYNHLLRAWRASQLRKERHFGPDDLMEFFQWRDYETAMKYAKVGVWGLAGKGLSTPKKLAQ